jgi:hypothetical protein
MQKTARKQNPLSEFPLPNRIMYGKKKMIEYCNSKGMLRTDKSLRMELVQAENPSIKS